MLGDSTNINKAPDPTNIIWEDLGITGNKLMVNSIKANLLMSILVIAGFCFFWYLKVIPNNVR